MRYRTSKTGIVTAIIETLDSKAITNMNIIVDTNKNKLRKRVGELITSKIRSMKPDSEMVMWKTSLGEFCIYKESSLDYNFESYKSKYKYIKTYLEFVPKKGKAKQIVIKSKKLVNKDYEGYDECPNCSKEGLLDFTITRGDNKLTVCKKCKDFDKLLTKLEKKLDKEKKKRKNK